MRTIEGVALGVALIVGFHLVVLTLGVVVKVLKHGIEVK